MGMQNNVALDWDELKPPVMRIHQNTVDEMSEIKTAAEKIGAVVVSGGVTDVTLDAIQRKLNETVDILKDMPDHVEHLARQLETKSNEIADAIEGGVSGMDRLGE